MEKVVTKFTQSRFLMRVFSLIIMVFVSLGLEGCGASIYYPPATNMIGQDTPSDRAPLSRHDYRWNRQLEGW